MFGCGSLVKRAFSSAAERLRAFGSIPGVGGRFSHWCELAEQELALLETEPRCFSPLQPALSPTTLMQIARNGEREFFDSMAESAELERQQSDKRDAEPPVPEGDLSASYSSYSLSCAAILSEDGECVLASSKRRHFADSTGRRKTWHERSMDGGVEKLTSVWTQLNSAGGGSRLETTLEGCASEEEFEQRWAMTAFGAAQSEVSAESRDDPDRGWARSELERLMEARAGDSRAFGPDEDAAKAAPEKDPSELGEGVTREARAKSREAAIAEGSRTQEEETTPAPAPQ